MKKIDGVARPIRDVLKGNKYAIDYYQREYRWESKQLAELVNDLVARFEQAWDPSHARREVEKYPYYFLGSIIISEKDGQPFIVDGQQRLTTLTLLLTFLRRLQQDAEEKVAIDDLIFSETYGEKSFNLDVPDRNVCMRELYEHGEYEVPEGASESVSNLVRRYDEIDDLFAADLRGQALPFFIDWLQNRVQIVQITAYTDDDAYAIFETMNDRGLKLTPADMLKGYLLANIESGQPRAEANDLWRKRLRELNDLYEDADADFLKTWLRSQYSTKIRERKRAAAPEDWDRIGTEFHRWLRDDHERIGLLGKQDFMRLITRDFDFYSRQFRRIAVVAKADLDPSSPLRFVRYNADANFTLQDQLLLAPLEPGDQPEELDLKMELVARYVDILVARRVWNFRSTAYSTMQYAMFLTMRNIRRLEPRALAEQLVQQLDSETETFDSNPSFSLHQQNKSQVHRLLARITDHVNLASELASQYDEFLGRKAVRYEVEHVWANHHERHLAEFAHEADFSQYRNRIGGLLLLPKSFNASYNDDTYEDKLPHYFSQNILARSLNSKCYEHNPGFVRYVKRSGLPFKAHPTFESDDLKARGRLYREIAKEVWNPQDLLQAAQRVE